MRSPSGRQKSKTDTLQSPKIELPPARELNFCLVRSFQIWTQLEPKLAFWGGRGATKTPPKGRFPTIAPHRQHNGLPEASRLPRRRSKSFQDGCKAPNLSLICLNRQPETPTWQPMMLKGSKFEPHLLQPATEYSKNAKKARGGSLGRPQDRSMGEPFSKISQHTGQ